MCCARAIDETVQEQKPNGNAEILTHQQHICLAVKRSTYVSSPLPAEMLTEVMPASRLPPTLTKDAACVRRRVCMWDVRCFFLFSQLPSADTRSRPQPISALLLPDAQTCPRGVQDGAGTKLSWSIRTEECEASERRGGWGEGGVGGEGRKVNATAVACRSYQNLAAIGCRPNMKCTIWFGHSLLEYLVIKV